MYLFKEIGGFAFQIYFLFFKIIFFLFFYFFLDIRSLKSYKNIYFKVKKIKNKEIYSCYML